jgi:hypothetical protein
VEKPSTTKQQMSEFIFDTIAKLVENRYTGVISFKLSFRQGGIRRCERISEEQVDFKKNGFLNHTKINANKR